MSSTVAQLDVGQAAPQFKLPQDGSGEVDLSDLLGQPVVLYFYPKDDTPGCTVEAIDFTAKLPEFSALGVQVLGVSPDSVKKHDKFKQKHDLAITLLADEEKQVVEAYGVWVEKSMYGRKYMGVERSTFLIGKNGHLARIWRKVKVPGHVDEVLAAASKLAEG